MSDRDYRLKIRGGAGRVKITGGASPIPFDRRRSAAQSVAPAKRASGRSMERESEATGKGTQ